MNKIATKPQKSREKSGNSRPTLVDVARAANVSTATVSMVVNQVDSGIRISQETRQRVLQAVEELNYTPNLMARSLKTRQTKVIGMVVADIRDAYFGEIIKGVEEALNEAGYCYILSSAIGRENLEQFNTDMFNQMRVDGILVAGLTSPAQTQIVYSLADRGVPIVTMSSDFPSERIPQVVLDYIGGTIALMEHLIELGHRRIAYIAGPKGERHSQLRRDGYRKALTEAGINYDSKLVVEGEITPKTGYKAMKKLLRLTQPPTAVFCINNSKAMGALRALWEAGVKVPENMSVATYDDHEVCEYLSPPVTAVRPPRVKMGSQAAKLLLQILNGSDSSELPRTIVLEPKLVVRQSTSIPSSV